jgi:hypothetical protein
MGSIRKLKQYLQHSITLETFTVACYRNRFFDLDLVTTLTQSPIRRKKKEGEKKEEEPAVTSQKSITIPTFPKLELPRLHCLMF